MERVKSIFFRILLLIGCSIYFYPTISDYVNNLNASRAIVEYREALGKFHGIEIDEIKQNADAYNQRLRGIDHPFANDLVWEGYRKQLNPFGNEMMGVVSIDKIDVNLPIYHDVNEGVIQVAAGHLPGSSLPVGGESTHAIITTHSGLPSAKLFTDLHKLEIGDEFVLSVLDKNLTYRVDQILTILPHEMESLGVVEGKDYVTMFTCTPYGINTHRLLVRGERIYKEETNSADDTVVEEVNVEEVAEKSIKTHLVKMAIFLAIFLTILLTIVKDIILLIINGFKKTRQDRS